MAGERVREDSKYPGVGRLAGRPAGFVRVVLLAGVLIAGAPGQAAAQFLSLQDVLDRVNAAVTAAGGARTAAEQARTAAVEMQTKLQSGLNGLTAELQTMVDEAAADARQILAEESAGRDAFLPGGQCAAACTAFRSDLIELLTNLETLSKSVVESTRLNADPDLSKFVASVQAAPGRVLYPLYRVTGVVLASDLPQRLDDAARRLQVLSALVLNGPQDLPDACEVIVPRTTEVEHAARAVIVVGAIVKVVGKLFNAVGETEFEGQAAVWGWVGGTIKSNWKKTLGETLTGLSDAMSKLAAYANGKLDLCATLAFRDESASALAAISAGLSALNLDLSHLDTPVSTRASQASVDGVSASLGRVGADVAALVGADTLPGGGSYSAVMLRIQIERALGDTSSAMAVFYLPQSFGGILEKVREIVEQDIIQHEAAGIPAPLARDALSRGDAAGIEGDHRTAYGWYQSAYNRLARQSEKQGK